MKIRALTIQNFRGIANVSINDLEDMVVIAGPNGSGKSCLLDGIRLLKSVYGGYQPNEWQQWLGEFQINFSQDPSAFWKIMQDRNKPLVIAFELSLHSDEKRFLTEHANELVRQSVWRTLVPESYGWGMQATSLAAQYRGQEAEANTRTVQQTKALLAELQQERIQGRFMLEPGGQPSITASQVLELVFSTYRPSDIGVIDYHGPQRLYGREVVQGINLNLDATAQQRSQHALYNSAGKYGNVKSEMAASYVREALAEKAGVASAASATLNETLKELFRRFFPDKEFLGPQATAEGLLRFPVRTSAGAEHDLDDLSAGEKEVLYGYLRLRHSAPKNSVILLDEPELHLNPKLLRGFSDFYQRYLGKALSNQIWLITHSDALLRESVGRAGYSVFHMQPMTAGSSGASQALPLSAEADVERAVMDLVGDLAAYRPGAKIVIFEGGEESEFDQRMTGTLFPAFMESINAIPGSNKSRVRQLHSILDRAISQGKIPMKVFSIVDWDTDDIAPPEPPAYQWDVYHIENYLLEPTFIRSVLVDIRGGQNVPAVNEICEQLRSAAEKTLPSLVRHRMGLLTNKLLVDCIKTNIAPDAQSISQPLFEVICSSRDRLQALVGSSLSLEKLTEMEVNISATLRADLGTDAWKRNYRGRDILRRFAGEHAREVKYPVLRDLIIARMRDAKYQPAGMCNVIEKITHD